MGKRILISAIVLFILSCNIACSQKENVLSADEFEKQLAASPAAQLVDVRTPEEFAEGHLKNALSMNINSDDLKNRSKYLDKTKSVFVYCYSGGRSASACKFFRNEGFAIVYDLKGGYSAWTDLNKPVEKINASVETGMSKEELDKIISSHKKVIVDVYAKWCSPCMKMEPDLKNLTEEFKNEVFVLRLEKDKNAALSQQLGVTEIPVF